MKHVFLDRFPLGNSRRAWKQDKLIFSTFSPSYVYYNKNLNNPHALEIGRNAVKTCADAGFNLLELGWATPALADAVVPMCEELGIDVISQDLAKYGGMQERIGLENKCELSDIRDVVNKMRPYKHCIGFYVWDEPYMPDQIKEARRQMDMFQQEVPEKLLFSVAIPSYNKEFTWKNGKFEGYLRRYLEGIDPAVLSLDYYPVGMKEHDEQRQCDESYMWCDLGLMKKLAKEYDMPLWFYYQGQNLHNVEFFIFPMVRMFMHAGLLYGAKGLQHYTACGAVTREEDGKPDIFFEDQKKIHAELREIGGTLMALDCKRVFHDESLLPGVACAKELHDDIAESELLAGKLPYRVSASELEDAYGNRYLMVLNRDYMTAKSIELDLKGSYRVYEVSKQDGEQHVIAENTEKLSIELAAGDMALLRLQNAADEAFTISYKLVKE